MPEKSEIEIDSPIQDTKYCGLTDYNSNNQFADYGRYIFSLTKNSTVYYSEDNGRTLINIKQRLINTLRKLQANETDHDGKVLKIISIFPKFILQFLNLIEFNNYQLQNLIRESFIYQE